MSSAKIGQEYVISAAIVLVTLVVARYAGRMLRQNLDARVAGLVSPDKGKALLRLPVLLQYFLIIQGLLLARDRLVFNQETAAILELCRLTLTLAGQALLLLMLAITIWGGTAVWSLLSSVKRPKKALAVSEPVETSGQGPDFKVVTDIAKLFTDIVRQHLAATPDTPSRISLCEQDPSRSKYVFDLQIQLPGGWKSRRMTIGRIGAESGSRSKCFYVIFDDYLVVKVPPEAITDLRDYIDSLKKEAVIAKQLELRECIIPRVSTIIKYVDDTLEGKTDLIDAREEIAMKLLFRHPRLTNYLKVGETFAYFMDMSRYYFLQDVIAALHDPSHLLADEINKHAKSNWKFSQHSANYDQEAAPLFQAMETVYAKYVAAVEDLFASEQVPFTAARHLLNGYFAARLLGEDQKFGAALPPLLLNRLARLTGETLTAHEALVARYRQTVGQLCDELLFLRSKAPVEGVVANLLELLAHIGAKGVALRDLKPDNLLVAGDRQHYPAFLSRPDEYKIGLIDIETAVIFGTPPGRQIEQPQLGGTPQYATPSHFFTNVLLAKMYGDLHPTLHLQDWHGMTGVIYKVITNRFLFEKTARIVPAIVGKINNSPRYDHGAQLSVAVAASRLFWEEAEKEFVEKTGSARGRLEKVEIRMPAAATTMFQTRLSENAHQTAGRIKTCIAGQTVYSSEKGRQALLQGSSSEIAQLIRQWQKVDDSRPTLLPHQPQALELLRRLAPLKAQHENLTQTLAQLAKPSPRISARLLLNSMFAVVKNHMVKDDWPVLSGRDEDQPLTTDVKPTSEATVATTDREYQTVIAN